MTDSQTYVDPRNKRPDHRELAAKTEVESRAAVYRRQKNGSREEWPGQHEAEAKKIESEEADAAKAKGVTAKPAGYESPIPIKSKNKEESE